MDALCAGEGAGSCADAVHGREEGRCYEAFLLLGLCTRVYEHRRATRNTGPWESTHRRSRLSPAASGARCARYRRPRRRARAVPRRPQYRKRAPRATCARAARHGAARARGSAPRASPGCASPSGPPRTTRAPAESGWAGSTRAARRTARWRALACPGSSARREETTGAGTKPHPEQRGQDDRAQVCHDWGR